jgi:hypothetical protein
MDSKDFLKKAATSPGSGIRRGVQAPPAQEVFSDIGVQNFHSVCNSKVQV